MQSPAVEWSVALSQLAVLDYLRSIGEADGDTLSECCRELVARHRHGRTLFAATMVVGAVALWNHIDSPLRR